MYLYTHLCKKTLVAGLYNKGVVVAIVLTMSAIVMLILLATYVIIVKVSKKKQGRHFNHMH